jgi:hypothetical protein
MANISTDYRQVTLSPDEAAVLVFLRRQLSDDARDQLLQIVMEDDNKDAARLLLLAYL